MTTQHSFTDTPYANLRTIYVCEQELISSTVKWINKVRAVMPKEEIKNAWLRVNELHKTSRQLHVEMCEREENARQYLIVMEGIQGAYVDKLIKDVFRSPTELNIIEKESIQIRAQTLRQVNKIIREHIEEYSLDSMSDAEVSAEHDKMLTE